MARKNSREKILKTTMKIIEKEGIQKLTVRRIADTAKVNVAAINYYFDSKDNLIGTAFETFRHEFDKCFNALDDENLSCKDRLIRFFNDATEAFIRQPGLIKSLFSSILDGKKEPESIFKGEDEHQRKIAELIGRCTGEKDFKMLVIRAGIMMSAMLHPVVVMDNDINEAIIMDYNDPDLRNKYVTLMVKGALEARLDD